MTTGEPGTDQPGGEAEEASEMTLLEHLAELRNRLLKALAAVAIGAVACWVVYPQLLDILLDPYCRLVADTGGPVETGGGCKLFVQDPLEGFETRIKIAAYGGIMLAMPVILWQLWRFVAPGLYQHERRYAVPFVLSALALFLLGAGLAFWTLPRALGFLSDIGGPDLVEIYSPARYLNLVVYMMLAFGVGFEFPILLVFLQMAGVIDTAMLRRARRFAIVGIFVLVAVITPSGDPVSLCALALPMWLFYECAILYGVLRERRRRRRPPE